jgi:hypothetical protein
VKEEFPEIEMYGDMCPKCMLSPIKPKKGADFFVKLPAGSDILHCSTCGATFIKRPTDEHYLFAQLVHWEPSIARAKEFIKSAKGD